jgi:nitrogen fixation protein NifB
MSARKDGHRHPCFNAEVKGECGRVHLPVAPKCNIKCNYCNRKYDCVNESRPGVTSSLLTPAQALRYVEQVVEQEPRITVAGIAGPGDPFANPRETLDTLRLIRGKFPQLLLCLASNGLGLAAHLDELAELGATHVTLTVNAVDPEIGQGIYAWVREGKTIYRGRRGVELLLERQLAAITGLKQRGIVVKVNTIVVPGINDQHVPVVARKMAALGVDLFNAMPMYPNQETPFAEVPEPSAAHMARIRAAAEEHLPQMRHCTRCRADAVGLLGADRATELRGCLADCSRAVIPLEEQRPYVAVATREGMLVNVHLGEAARFQIWGPSARGFELREERAAPEPGSGPQRWWALAAVLQDCRAVLVSGIGDTPRAILTECGLLPVEMEGFVETGLDAVYHQGDLSRLKTRRLGCSQAAGCSGQGGGCM